MSLLTNNLWEASIYVAGNINTAEIILRRECSIKLFCVRITTVKFIYAYGVEEGVEINTFINPKHSDSTKERLTDVVHDLVWILINELHQKSATLIIRDFENMEFMTKTFLREI